MKKKVTVIVQPGQDSNMGMFSFLSDYSADVRFIDECIIQSDTGLMRNRQMETMGPDSFEYTDEYIEKLSESDIIITAMAPVPSVAFEAGNVEAVCILRSGIDNVDREKAKAAGVKVINAPGRLSVPVSEFTVGMIIAEMKNVGRGYANLSQGKWINRYPNRDYNRNLRGSFVGIVGFGAIGTKVAKVMNAFGANVLVYDPFVPEDKIYEAGCIPMSLNELCEKSDVITIHMPLNDSTAGIIGPEQFSHMKSSVCLINTARGELYDQEALLDALKNHRIGGAAIDVFPDEPLSPDSPFIGLDNVTITPHLAGYCCNNFELSFEIVADSLKTYFETGEWTNIVKL